MRQLRHLAAAVLLIAAAGCGHKADTTTTTTSAGTTTTASVAPAAAGTMSAAGPPGFATEAAAQEHCTADQVVWLNTKSKVYHEKGMPYYGHTKAGAYVCRKEADAAGDRDAKNGS
jgi:hypothetical protein